MAYVLANIGSNLGNPRLNISRAVRAIGETFGDFEISHAVESDPWGFDSTHSFVNVGIAFHSELPPLSILTELQKIEKAISPASHRNPDGSYADRMIDIDLIAIDTLVIDTSQLTVPHPRLAMRRFVLEPLAELAPGWRHPLTGLYPFEMLSELDNQTETSCNPE